MRTFSVHCCPARVKGIIIWCLFRSRSCGVTLSCQSIRNMQSIHKTDETVHINLWSLSFYWPLMNDRWPCRQLIRSHKRRNLPNKAFFTKFWWFVMMAVLSGISQTCERHSSTPTSLFVSLSVGGRTACTLPPSQKVTCYNFNQRALLWTFDPARWPQFYLRCKISYFVPLTFYFRDTDSLL